MEHVGEDRFARPRRASNRDQQPARIACNENLLQPLKERPPMLRPVRCVHAGQHSQIVYREVDGFVEKPGIWLDNLWRHIASVTHARIKLQQFSPSLVYRLGFHSRMLARSVTNHHLSSEGPMAKQAKVTRQFPAEKARTGIEGLDEITNGGLPRRLPTLVAAPRVWQIADGH